MKTFYTFFFFLLLTIPLQAQFVKRIVVKGGFVIAGQRTPPSEPLTPYNLSSPIACVSGSIEPTFLIFGKEKQAELTADISYIQKGAVNANPIYAYGHFGYVWGTGEEHYEVRINYVSLSPCIKLNFAKQLLFVKIGPRIDFLTGFQSKEQYSSPKRTLSDFEPVTYGITYGAGITAGKKRMKFLFEILAEQDVTVSSLNKGTGQYYKNYAVLFNFGTNISLGKISE